MPKRKLEKTYLFRGGYYGPGEVDVPDEFPEDKGEAVKPKSKPKKSATHKESDAKPNPS